MATTRSRGASPVSRILAGGVLVAAVALTLGVVRYSLGGGGGGSGGSATARHAGASSGSDGTLTLDFVRAGYQLPGQLVDAATAAVGGQVIVAGGRDVAGRVRRRVTVFSARAVVSEGLLAAPLTGAAAAYIGPSAYLFGGDRPSGPSAPGSLKTTAAILKLSSSGATQTVGQLPAALKDEGAAVVGGVAYLIGGFDAGNQLASVLAWSPGSKAHLVATLPVGLSFPAVAAVGSQILIAGGTTTHGASRAIYGFDPADRRVSKLATLPMAITHAAAVSADGRLFVLGGRALRQGTQTDRIVAYDPRTRAVSAGGLLPRALSDVEAATLSGGEVLLAGGIDPTGQVHELVYVAHPRRPVSTARTRATSG